MLPLSWVRVGYVYPGVLDIAMRTYFPPKAWMATSAKYPIWMINEDQNQRMLRMSAQNCFYVKILHNCNSGLATRSMRMSWRLPPLIYSKVVWWPTILGKGAHLDDQRRKNHEMPRNWALFWVEKDVDILDQERQRDVVKSKAFSECCEVTTWTPAELRELEVSDLVNLQVVTLQHVERIFHCIMSHCPENPARVDRTLAAGQNLRLSEAYISWTYKHCGEYSAHKV